MRSPHRRLFGTDGARGIANADLTPSVALSIGRAFGSWLAGREVGKEVLVARDTRVSGTMLAAAIEAGLCSVGINVVDTGILTTPALCLLTRHEKKAGGVVVSASHNPPAFNGIKLVDSLGNKYSEELERAIEDMVFAEEDLAPRPTSGEVGMIQVDQQAHERYLDILLDSLGTSFTLDGLRVVLDCCYGAAFQVAPEAFGRAGAQVWAINATADGARINVGCGSLHPQALAEKVVALGADIGIAFDGDGDRAIFVDDEGQVRDGDFAKFLLATDMHDRGLLYPPVVVGTVMSNLGLELALRQKGVELARADVGDKHVVDLMQRVGARLGGEQSGHIVFAETNVGDGIYTGLRVSEILVRSGRPLSELCAPLQKVPQVLMNVPVVNKHAWEKSARVQGEVRVWEQKLKGKGRILIRASGTEPLVRVMVEALDEALAVEAADDLSDLIGAECGGPEAGEEE
jgi:phosphoglucosamine mutase